MSPLKDDIFRYVSSATSFVYLRAKIKAKQYEVSDFKNRIYYIIFDDQTIPK